MTAIYGLIARFQTLAGGSFRVWLDLPETVAPEDLPWLSRRGQAVGIAPLGDTAQSHGQARYGAFARDLRLSGFTRAPAVWAATGSDTEFLAWVKDQPCACRFMAAPVCGGDVVAAHVRRVADGAGAGLKPPYSAIPLCDTHHRLQHQKGESALGGKERLDEWRIAYLSDWVWETLKKRLGYEHWSQVPPNVLLEWAQEHDVVRYLPEIYRSEA